MFSVQHRVSLFKVLPDMLSSLNGLGALKFPQIYLTLAHNPITFVPTPEIGSKMQMSCPPPPLVTTYLSGPFWPLG